MRTEAKAESEGGKQQAVRLGLKRINTVGCKACICTSSFGRSTPRVILRTTFLLKSKPRKSSSEFCVKKSLGADSSTTTLVKVKTSSPQAVCWIIGYLGLVLSTTFLMAGNFTLPPVSPFEMLVRPYGAWGADTYRSGFYNNPTLCFNFGVGRSSGADRSTALLMEIRAKLSLGRFTESLLPGARSLDHVSHGEEPSGFHR